MIKTVFALTCILIPSGEHSEPAAVYKTPTECGRSLGLWTRENSQTYNCSRFQCEAKSIDVEW